MEEKDGYNASDPIELQNRANNGRTPYGASLYSRAVGNHAFELNQRIAKAAAMLGGTEIPLDLKVITLQLASGLAEIKYAVHGAAIYLA